MTRCSRRALLGGASATCVTLGLLPRRALARDTATERKAAVLARALSYEYTLAERIGARVDVTLAHRGVFSKAEAEQWRDALASLRVSGKSLVARLVDITPSLNGIRGADIDILIACGALDAGLIAQLSQISAAAQALSVGTRRTQVQQALTFGVFEQGEKLQMVVNLAAAEREGVRFNSKLLRLAKVIR